MKPPCFSRLFILTCAQARVKAMHSIVSYMETFLGDDVDPEKMYYFTCVQLALSFIRDLDWNKVSERPKKHLVLLIGLVSFVAPSNVSQNRTETPTRR